MTKQCVGSAKTSRWPILLLAMSTMMFSGCVSYDPLFGGGSDSSDSSGEPAAVGQEEAETDSSSGTSPAEPEVTAPRIVRTVPKPTGPAAFLLAESQRYRSEKNFVAAAASIERAMRIEPGSPWLNVALAQIRLDQNNVSQGETLAKRALSKAASDSELKQTIWQTIARARELAGDERGASEARQQALMHGSGS